MNVITALRCAACGHQNREFARFCGHCGAPLAARVTPVGKRELTRTFKVRERLHKTFAAGAAVAAPWGVVSLSIPRGRSAISESVPLLVAGLLAVLAQWLFVRTPNWPPLPAGLVNPFRPVWPNVAPVLTGVSLLLVASAVVAWWTRRTDPPRASAVAVCLFAPARPWGLAAVAAFVGLGLQAWVLARLVGGTYLPSYPRLYALGLVLELAVLTWCERTRLRPLVQRIRLLRSEAAILWEALFVVAATGVFAFLSVWDLGSWYYSAIGDEYAFYSLAREIAEKATVFNLFSQRGVYEQHPMLAAYFDGRLMQIFGLDVVGWKTATVVPVILAVLAAYLLARALYGRRVGLLTLSFLVTAHYLLAFDHAGYYNLQPLFSSTVTLLLLVVGLRHRSMTLLALCGAVAALGWYTFFSARAAILIIGVTLLVTVRWRSLLTSAWPLASGFLVAVAPMVFANGWGTISRMFVETGAGTPTEAAANRTLLPLWNAGRSLLAFNYNTRGSHFVSGSLVEPVTAALFTLGLMYTAANWRDVRHRLLLGWFFIGILVTGVISKYDYVSVTRLNYLVPVVAIMAALGCAGLLQAVAWPWGTRVGLAASALVTVIIVGFASFDNLHRWFVETPSQVPTTPESVVIRTIEDPRCQSSAEPTLVVQEGSGGLLPSALQAIGGLRQPRLELYQDGSSWIDTMTDRCVIFSAPQQASATELLRTVAQRWPQLIPTNEYDRSHKVFVTVFYPATGQ